ncbi:MAG: iron ABC transporter permease [Acetobacteraceae bacterium]|nr:iron ABC transporter permease [Acetobacteraceae bacterium]
MLAPVLGLVVLAFQGTGEIWRHLAAYVLPDALRQTAMLLSGTAAVAALAGIGAAWLVTSFDFPGRKWLEWALLLPLAMPTYIVAYAYADVLHPIGPVQTGLRMLLGIDEVRGLVFPDIRSMPGCILVMGFALYPYVYISTRAALLMQSAEAIEAARGLGASGSVLIRRVVLPIASPAIGVGLGLVMMEALADIGASEFLGVRTLTVAVYVTWTTRGSVEGAAQIALAILALTFVLLAVERAMARHRDQGAGERAPLRRSLTGAMAALATIGCTLPMAVGFAVPTLHLLVNAAIRIAEFGFPAQLGNWTWNSLRLATLATATTLCAGFLIAFCQRHLGSPASTLLLRVSALGYALPGTVLAVGLLGPMAWFDEAMAIALDHVGRIAVPALSGSAAALVLAYSLRFLAIPANTLESAYRSIPSTVDDAARGLGAPDRVLAGRIHLPLLSPAAAASALMVLIECMKELPATLLLRPLNVETLATAIYGEASRGTYEEGAVAALAIVAVGLIPVVILVRGFKLKADGRRRSRWRRDRAEA